MTYLHYTGEIERDEIDNELLGGDPKHWQTNVFAPTVQDPTPHYGKFNAIEMFPQGGSQTIATFHSYTIDWNSERIVWSVDGIVARTLHIGVSYLTHLCS